MTGAPIYDLVLVGGGLASGLIAWRIAQLRPDVRILLLEAGESPGGNHTWCFHDGDLDAAQAAWIAPFLVHAWPSYDVCFPDRSRTIGTGYAAVTSERFAALLRERLGPAIRTLARVANISPDGVTLEGGERIGARAVIDGRGHEPSPHLTLGYQKFLGLELELAAPHGLTRPIVMDATVAQADGYRFVYVLPFDERRLLVEDTYYADGPELAEEGLRASITRYAQGKGWRIARILRTEQGVLPIALGGDISAFWAARKGIPAAGLAAALFHPTTGYSLPDAVCLADRIAKVETLDTATLFAETRAHSMRQWRDRRFFRMLNRLLFFAGEPTERYRVLQHFYRLPDPLVARFYAGRLTIPDRMRILTGKPPVPILGALGALALPLRPRALHGRGKPATHQRQA